MPGMVSGDYPDQSILTPANPAVRELDQGSAVLAAAGHQTSIPAGIWKDFSPHSCEVPIRPGVYLYIQQNHDVRSLPGLFSR
jgi:hypothetical protein